jgi:hypothetical protein
VLFFSVVTHEFNEDCAEQREDQRLNKSDEEFHEVERKSRKEGQPLWDKPHETFESLLTAVYISKKTEAKCYWTDKN